MTERVTLWTAAIFAAVVAATSIELIPAAAQQAPDLTGDADQGKITYAKNCSHCHGPNLVNSGTITPDLRGFPNDKTRFVTTVKQGKNNKMPPWQDILQEQEIADVWAFISSRRRP